MEHRFKWVNDSKTVLELYQYEEESNDRWLQSGCKSIDHLLQGGFRRGLLHEICGGSGTGKTQLCLQLLLQVQLPESLGGLDGSACYITTKGTSIVHRLGEIANKFNERYLNNSSNKPINFLENIFIERLFELDELIQSLQLRIPKLLEEHNVKLVIVDSIATLFRSDLANESMDYSARSKSMFEIANFMKILMAEYDATFVVVNQVSSYKNDFHLQQSGTLPNPSLGVSWSGCINQRLILTRSQINTNSSWDQEIVSHISKSFYIKRKVHVALSPYLPQDSCEFIISEEGIISFETKTRDRLN